MSKVGTLYLVATPIGNLEDITLRGLRVLKEVDMIAAEDTRQTIKLLNHFEIRSTLVSYHEHNKKEKGSQLIDQLLEGKDIALVSDAGSPGISDPGEDLVKLAAENGIEGFLPMNKRVRSERLQAIKEDVRTLVFYEAPHKLNHTLKDLRTVFGNRRIALARELTKRFEEIMRCTLDEAIARYEQETPKGEFVLIVDGADQKSLENDRINNWNEISLEDHVKRYTDSGLDRNTALKKVADDRGIRKRDVYNGLIEQKNKGYV